MLDKAVVVLRAAAAAPCALSELCERTGLPRATAHRLAVGLESHRLLDRAPDGRWRPGPALSELAHGHRDPLLEAAEDVLPRLRDRTGESVQLYRRDGDLRVCVAAAEPTSGLRDTVPVGVRLPMTAGSGARILAAWSPEGSAFDDDELAVVRRRGWAQSTAEREAGVASVSAPVRSPDGDVVAAVSVSGPTDRIARRSGAGWAEDVLTAARQLEARLRPASRVGGVT